MSVVEFILENNNISYTQLRSDQKRGKNIIKLTVDALKEEVFPNDLRITWKVYAGDCPIEFDNISKDKYTFSTVEVAGKSHLAYPCFMFDNWKDCGILDYEDLINS